jgi:hypothetical protein
LTYSPSYEIAKFRYAGPVFNAKRVAAQIPPQLVDLVSPATLWLMSGMTYLIGTPPLWIALHVEEMGRWTPDTGFHILEDNIASEKTIPHRRI